MTHHVRRTEMEMPEECVWGEVTSSYGFIYLLATANLRLTQLQAHEALFRVPKTIIRQPYFHALRLGYLNVTLFDWKLGVSPAISEYYNKTEGGRHYFLHLFTGPISV